MMTTLLSIAAGGAIGATARYLTNTAVMRLVGPGFPWGTVVANVAGSFLMGVLVVVLAHKGGMRFAPFLMTGVLGGFTTFSAFSLDTMTLIERGATAQAGAYVLGSVVLSVTALAVGMVLARGIVA
ncbi:fluoride efflux transporter CrcB [Loktanella sp. IMCC34160]|uniref:fluoride efflux transporter CrcB n=1 Tax=Loktanella sp. IMCC34160 TaxID=2510646 RepID=UPI00101D2C1C|nr:fluoride efflux transporter CrcB [Loktanella sp. IMCC34160]RYG92588.1 fluoride efflux transporter CrcB [Loktanella sp. IMCC34160]